MTMLIWAANRWDNWLGNQIRRVLCRVLHQHTLGCRGRADHIRDNGLNIDPDRWHP